MRDYNGFSYRPDYGYEIYQGGKLVNKEQKVQWAACFAEVFKQYYSRNQEVFESTYTLRCRKEFVYESGNFCALTKPEIQRILQYMRKTFKISVFLTETDSNYVFTFKVIGKPIKHKFVLTFSRVFYEFPYNELARDVFRLRELDKFCGINVAHKSFLELFQLVTSSYSNGICNGHSLFRYPNTSLPAIRLAEAFEEGISQVQGVYVGSYDLFNELKMSNQNRRIDWDNGFKNRVERYSDNFKIIRKHKQNDKKNIRRRARKAVQ